MKRSRTYSNGRGGGKRRKEHEPRTNDRMELVAVPRAPRYIPETKYFDCGINTFMSPGGADWTDTEVPCDNYINSSGTSASYTDACLLPTAIGSSYGEVNGNRFRLKKIRVRGRVLKSTKTAQTEVATPVSVRVLLVLDTQANGVQAQGEDIMQDIGAQNECLYAFKRVQETSGRFRILKDQFFTLDPATAANNASATTISQSYDSKYFSMQYQPREPMLCHIKTGNSTPTVGGCVDNNIFLLSYSTEQIVLIGASRAYYVD